MRIIGFCRNGRRPGLLNDCREAVSFGLRQLRAKMTCHLAPRPRGKVEATRNRRYCWRDCCPGLLPGYREAVSFVLEGMRPSRSVESSPGWHNRAHCRHKRHQVSPSPAFAFERIRSASSHPGSMAKADSALRLEASRSKTNCEFARRV